jgi:pyridoxal phosphate enzyme (YggS family)
MGFWKARPINAARGRLKKRPGGQSSRGFLGRRSIVEGLWRVKRARTGATESLVIDEHPFNKDDVLARLRQLRQAIARRAADCGRDPASVRLMAVSKTFSADEVWPTIAEADQRLFGENRVQEAQAKWADLRARAAKLDKAIELHLIGPLQSNKAREAVEAFDAIETVDREKIAAALAEAMAKAGKKPRLFVQVNTGSEPQKAGVNPRGADAFIALCREKYRLEIAGLMCIPPVDEQASPHFALLGAIAKRCGIAELSMGMSADWELAVQLGATYVRIGTAIFGSRA